MSKKLSLALALALALTCGACSGQPAEPVVVPETLPETTAPSAAETTPEAAAPIYEGLDDLRMRMEPSGAVAGIFFLGYHDGLPLDEAFWEMADPYTFRNPFMLEVDMEHYAAAPGGEIYCVVPADPNARVRVTEWDDLTAAEGAVLYESSTGEPFFLQGNVSDIMPNLSVTIEDGFGNLLEQYHPCISLKDGLVQLPDQPVVLDFTVSEPVEGDPIAYSFDYYLPNETEDGYITMTSSVQFVDPDLAIQLLIEHRVLPDTVEVNTWYTNEAGDELYMDFNQELPDYLSSLTDPQETLILGALIRSSLSAMGSGTLYLTVDGAPMDTAHARYDQPLYWNSFWN